MPERRHGRQPRARAPWPALLPALLACALARSPAATAAEHLRMGSLELSPCSVGAQHGSWVASQAAWCTSFDVPENWDEPAGRHIGLHVALVRAAAAETDRDVVAFLDGGPGGAATQDYPAVAAALAPLRKRHHILLVDQRGTGASNALDCNDDLYLEADKPTRTAVGAEPRGAQPEGAAQREAVRRCLAALAVHAAPQFYATTDAVRDLEAVRHALGDVPLDLVGVSYGTRVAQQYAARYPGAVRSVVLDSPVPNRLALMSEHARNLEEALRQRLARCTATAACAARFGDPYESLAIARERLRRQPQLVELHDPQTFATVQRRIGAGDLAELVRFYLYSDATSALLPLVITEARDGRYGPVLAQAQLVVGDVTEHLSSGMAASVMCAEDADLLHEDPADEGTLLGGGIVRSAIATCAQWPHRARPADFHKPFDSALPVLVLSGQFDPVTPARYGAEIVAGLAHARQLVAPGQGHAVIGAGCMPRLVSAFVQDRDPARLDDSCLKALGDTPAFLTVNGAAP
jgi:pimeloyl-ACP methyl ester carboxylesterase